MLSRLNAMMMTTRTTRFNTATARSPRGASSRSSHYHRAAALSTSSSSSSSSSRAAASSSLFFRHQHGPHPQGIRRPLHVTNAATEQPPSAQGVRKAFVTRAAPTGPRKVVILGTGWAAARLAQDLDPAKHTIWVVSPRNHMVFTPLLASTTVGTLDFRSVTVSMRNIQPALNTGPHRYVTALAENIDLEKKQVVCRAADETDETFSVRYDDLCIATGAQGSTFGIPGVEEHAFFLRDVANADAIRNRIVRNISLAQIPECKEEERRKLLSFVIVGGGPTGVEFAGELANLVNEDLKRIACRIYPLIRITLIEGDRVLGTSKRKRERARARTHARSHARTHASPSPPFPSLPLLRIRLHTCIIMRHSLSFPSLQVHKEPEELRARQGHGGEV